MKNRHHGQPGHRPVVPPPAPCGYEKICAQQGVPLNLGATDDLAILIDSGDKRPALVSLNAHIPILFTSAKRTSCNAQLIEDAKRLLARKRGPCPAVMPVQVLSEVA